MKRQQKEVSLFEPRVNPRGQVTGFIVAGISILIAIGLFIVVFNMETEQPIQSSTIETNSIRNYVDACVKTTTEDAIYFVGIQGGYFDAPADSKQVMSMKSPYYHDLGIQKVPSLPVIEIEISKYLKENIDDCVNNLELFSEQGYSLEFGEFSSEVSIRERDIFVNVDYPIKIIRGESQSEISSFNAVVNFDFKEKYNIVLDILEEQERFSNSFPISYIGLSGYENGFTFETIDFGEGNVLLYLIFREPNRELPFIYSFMLRYDWA